ncbi:MAG: hypothetical protein ABIZ49_01575 [Opitutaceae bacterium]
MRTIKLALVFLFAALTLTTRAFAAESTSVRAILVVASNEKGGTDPKLAPHERALRGVLPYQSYRVADEGSASVSSGGKASISLAGGNSVELQGDASGIKVIRGGRPVSLAPGSPVVLLGGPAGGKGDRYAIIVTVN